MTTPWDEWEDWQAGMYTTDYQPHHVNDSADLLADPDTFYETAREMIRAWPNAARHNLHNMWTGRNAWIGQAACTYAHQAPAAATRQAWGQITVAQQNAANRVARQLRDEWEQADGRQTLFD